MGQFSTALKTLREKNGIGSIRAAARELAISHVHLYEMEKGLKFPSSELIYRISRFYDVSPVYLLILIEKDKGRSTDENKVAVARYIMDMPEDEFRKLQADDEILKLGDMRYPRLLAETEEAPRFLYLRGDSSLLHDSRTIALVGSRNASERGLDNTRRVAATLGRNGIIVVSGLAKGIDAAAHRAALANGFRTIAVIGTNLNQYYPNENRELQIEIEKKGLVISQFSPALRTERWFFPLRNGVMSGLSRATVIMEAGETSGALTQAKYATKQKRLVLIPQNAFLNPAISWPRMLVDKGAVVVRTPQEIIQTLSERLAKQEEPRSSDIPDLFAEDEFGEMFIAEGKAYSGN